MTILRGCETYHFDRVTYSFSVVMQNKFNWKIIFSFFYSNLSKHASKLTKFGNLVRVIEVIRYILEYI